MIISKINPAEQLFKKFFDAYKKRDLAAIMGLFTQKANMWGTGADEYRVGLKQIEQQIKRDWSQSEEGELELQYFIPTRETATWTAAVCQARLVVNGKKRVFPDLRGTIMAENEDGQWKISHMHASFPDYRNAEGGSFPEEMKYTNK